MPSLTGSWLHEHGKEVVLNAALINDLRNAARHELGFGTGLSLGPAMAWIGNLTGAATDPPSAIATTQPVSV
jgi:hypothetical protein